MSTLLDLLIGLLSIIWSVVSWLLWQLVWMVVWFLLPFAVVAFIALRIAEKALGPEVVRAWVKRQSMKLGTGVWARTRRVLFAVGVLPVRVLWLLAVYTVWHSIVNLFWRPRWTPWQRAWGRRWTESRSGTASKVPSKA